MVGKRSWNFVFERKIGILFWKEKLKPVVLVEDENGFNLSLERKYIRTWWWFSGFIWICDVGDNEENEREEDEEKGKIIRYGWCWGKIPN